MGHERNRSSRRTQLRRKSWPQYFAIVCCCGVLVLLFFYWWSVTNGMLTAQRMDDTHPSTLLVSETKAAKHNNDNQQSVITFDAADPSTPNSNNKKILVFHEARPDRSGATVHDMLLAHAFAFQQNQTYGGACAAAGAQPLEHLQDHLEMIEALGLGHVLRFACPDDYDDDKKSNKNDAAAWIDRHLYTRFGTRIWTPEWLEHIRGQQQRVDSFSLKDNKKEHGSRRTFLAHVRRGDVDLCDPATRDRYLTNQHYRTLLDQYAAITNKGDEVIIFSEQKSTESWDDFANYNLQLDQPPALAWKAMMDADVLILSKSSFSIVPALFNRKGVVVYTPFWVEPLAHWTRVDDDTDRAERRAQIRLQHQLCDENNDA